MLKPSFHIEINAGKGWVGKSTVSASKALFSALQQNKKTLIIDMDGWVALARVISIAHYPVNQITQTDITNLAFASIQMQNNFLSLSALKKTAKKWQAFAQYMSQFPEDYWLVAFNDMACEFFGLTTDVPGLYKLISLLQVLHQASNDWYEAVLIDVEPTAWLERLLTSLDRASRSIENLQKAWRFRLEMIQAAWEDIGKFLKSPYIRQADTYTSRLDNVYAMLKNAKYSVVTLPEPEPLAQVNDVIKIVHNIQWQLAEIIVNKRGELDHETEEAIISKGKEIIHTDEHVLRKNVPYHPEMFTGKDRHQILADIGAELNR